MDIKRITFEIDDESYRRFKKKCIDDNVFISDVMRRCVWDWINYYPSKE